MTHFTYDNEGNLWTWDKRVWCLVSTPVEVKKSHHLKIGALLAAAALISVLLVVCRKDDLVDRIRKAGL